MPSLYSKTPSLCCVIPLCAPPYHSCCVQWMTAIGNQSNSEHSSLAVATKTPQVSGGREGGKKVVAEREKIKMWISRELSSKKQSKGLTSQFV